MTEPNKNSSRKLHEFFATFRKSGSRLTSSESGVCSSSNSSDLTTVVLCALTPSRTRIFKKKKCHYYNNVCSSAKVGGGNIKIDVFAHDINGIIYYIDKYDNVYDTEAVMNGSINPPILAMGKESGWKTHHQPLCV